MTTLKEAVQTLLPEGKVLDDVVSVFSQEADMVQERPAEQGYFVLFADYTWMYIEVDFSQVPKND